MCEVRTMQIKQISVELEHIPGTLWEVTNVLAAKNVNIRVLTVLNSTEKSTVRLIVDNVLWAASALRGAGFEVELTEVLAVDVPNESGGLNKVLEVLKNAGVNIEYLYDVGHKYYFHMKDACIVFKFTDNLRAYSVLKDAGVKVVDAEEMLAF